MSFGDPISRQSVLKAIDEFDEIGRRKFLAKYGFGSARNYFLEYKGCRYDSKAIVGAAHGYEYPASGPLGPYDFSGGRSTVKPKLESLGFRVRILK